METVGEGSPGQVRDGVRSGCSILQGAGKDDRGLNTGSIRHGREIVCTGAYVCRSLLRRVMGECEIRGQLMTSVLAEDDVRWGGDMKRECPERRYQAHLAFENSLNDIDLPGNASMLCYSTMSMYICLSGHDLEQCLCQNWSNHSSWPRESQPASR